jgi:flagellar biosynthesis anti-sigma factor FlgM
MKIGATNEAAKVDNVARVAASGANALDAVVGPSAQVNQIRDQVQLSGTASALLAGKDMPFDAEKVAAIKKAIEDRQFEIKHEKIAQKMISESAQLLQSLVSGAPKG